MTQERYQEAAEECGRIAGIRQSYDQTDQADLMILARDILSKLASGWVLVPEEPTPEILQAMHDGPLCASEYQMDEKAKAWLIDMYNAAIAAAPKP